MKVRPRIPPNSFFSACATADAPIVVTTNKTAIQTRLPNISPPARWLIIVYDGKLAEHGTDSFWIHPFHLFCFHSFGHHPERSRFLGGAKDLARGPAACPEDAKIERLHACEGPHR